MSRSHFTRYVCDVLGCHGAETQDFRNGTPDVPPPSWGFLTISTLRGHSNVPMWLCPLHFKTIDDWHYKGTNT